MKRSSMISVNHHYSNPGPIPTYSVISYFHDIPLIIMIDPPAASSFSLLTGNLRFVWRPPFRQLARWLFVEHHIKEKLQEVEDNDGAKPADHPNLTDALCNPSAASMLLLEQSFRPNCIRRSKSGERRETLQHNFAPFLLTP